ncbi:uncharacterized protein CG7065-like isoform X2 [Cylas formicarius]|nr:uncharacterized protein CG7065-like isoform X2 [Cylas formicarius]
MCECPIMGRVYQHELGRRHTTVMQITNRHLQKKDVAEKIDDSVHIEIAPGEPAPPGFEGEVDNRRALIQERLDGFKVGPLVALEYLIEMQDIDPSREPLYLCLLCDKRGDPRTVLTHLASYNHISQYLQKHFPTCYRALAPYMTKQYKRNWQIALQKIAEAIEVKYGRLRPFSIEKDKFEQERMNFIQLINRGKHFSELSGTTFIELVVHDELTKVLEEKPETKPAATDWAGRSFIEKPPQKRDPSPPVVARPVRKIKPATGDKPATKPPPATARRRSLSSVSSVSSDEETTKNGRGPPKNLQGGQPSRRMPYGRERNYRRRSPVPPARRRPSPPPRRSPSPRGKLPWEKGNYGGKGDCGKPQQQQQQQSAPPRGGREKERQEKIEELKRLSKAIETDMERTLKNHERNPEKHPRYNDEWKKFWNRRYKELQAQGKDAAKHDFKPEWIDFWGKKMLEMHRDELKARKDGLRKRLGLPDEVAPVSFRIGGGTKGAAKPTLPMAARPDNDPEVIVIDDKDDDKKRARPSSPWERESPPPKMAVKASKRSVTPPARRRSRSRSRDSRRSSHRGRSRSPPLSSSEKRRSRERSRDSYRSGGRERGRYSRERSWEREKKYRESSYERDLRGRERVRTVADLPWEREKDRMMYPHGVILPEYGEYYGPPPGVMMMRDITRKPVMMAPGVHGADVDDDDDGEVNLVSVLRLLTALEERLGSLGPKIIDLLAQALALEKKEANSSETLLDNEINCVMFETVKEKLKGQLLAGLVDPIQERAFKKAIQKTANLVHVSEQRRRQRDHLKPQKEKTPVVVPGVGKVDKAAIAKQVANALVAQGKTDVTQAELEQLINAVVGMAEASRTSSRPVTTASFLDGLAAARATSDIKEAEKSESPGRPLGGAMENLSDSDLQTLLQNFKDLSTEEQMNLINYLKKLEIDDPERVERLRKFVNLGSGGQKPGEKEDDVVVLERDDGEEEEEEEEEREDQGRDRSPFSARRTGGNPDVEHRPEDRRKIVDSEDEDYTFEDVVKTVSQNVQQREMDNKRKVVEDSINYDNARKDVDLTDAKALISNLMGNMNKTGTSASGVDLLGLGSSNAHQQPSSELTKTLSSINMENLASIVSNVQSLTSQLLRKTAEENQLKFEPPTSDARRSVATKNQPVATPTFQQGPPRGPAPRGFRGGPEPRPLVQYPPKGFGNQYGTRPPRQPGAYGFPRGVPPRPGFNRW